MNRRRSRFAVVIALGVAVAAWQLLRERGQPSEQALGHEASPRVQRGSDLASAIARMRAIAPPPVRAVKISGTVIDNVDHAPVGKVEVVFRGALGETTTEAASDGSYVLVVAPGSYHAF